MFETTKFVARTASSWRTVLLWIDKFLLVIACICTFLMALASLPREAVGYILALQIAVMVTTARILLSLFFSVGIWLLNFKEKNALVKKEDRLSGTRKECNRMLGVDTAVCIIAFVLCFVVVKLLGPDYPSANNFSVEMLNTLPGYYARNQPIITISINAFFELKEVRSSGL